MTAPISVGDQSGSVAVSFVIPALNEAHHLPATLRALKDHVPSAISYEVIVVDNGSTDGTEQAAAAGGAAKVLRSLGSPGAARNVGVAQASGTILVFLDADVLITPEWKAAIESKLAMLRDAPRTVTGSWVSIPPEASWIEECWFGPLEHRAHRHVNSGHMIISRAFFAELGGFDATLRSGEDWDLSRRAIAAGGRLVPDQELRVIHVGYPRTLRKFFSRELWHGAGDVRSFRAWIRSPVAVVASAWLLSFAVLLVALLRGSLSTTLVAALFAAGTPAAAAWRTFRGNGVKTLAVNTFLFGVYFAARALAVLSPSISGAHGTRGAQRGTRSA